MPQARGWSVVAVAAGLLIGCGAREEMSGKASSCPAGSILEVDLEAWGRAIEAAADLREAADYAPLLGQLGLAPLEGGPMALVSVEVLDLRRGGGTPADRLVAARFRGADGAESLRTLAVRPLSGGDDVYCTLGDELSHHKESGEEPCMHPYPGPARSLSVESLLAADRDSIRVRDAGGWCGGGTRRGDRFSTSYWGVEHGRLVRYFEAITAEAWYNSPDPPVEMRRGEIELSDSWPKTITLTEVVECRDADHEAPGGGCRPSERTSTWHYVDDRYVDLDHKAAAEGGGNANETGEIPR